ncbi:MAG TPA: Ig-like domain-containing protein [Melioribacteraceae bacterium]|nr:Ig-like domain-containing protein [Melioribacteraceae bacterium]
MRKFIYIILVIIFISCANQLPPSGGPVDKEPPEIINFYPASGTINFNDDYFEFSFNEYVDKRSFQDAFFISPKIDSKLEYNWSGKSVKILFDKSKLKENTTYTINIGTDLIDINNRNKMIKSYNLFFSTGNKIDEGKITGKVYFSNEKDAFIFAYRDKGDSLNPSKIKPDYLTQVGNDGSFSLIGLGNGIYKLFAFTDELRDVLYNAGEDKYGVAYKDVELSEKQNKAQEINFILAIEDTNKPGITNVTMTDKNHILVEFNEFIDSSKISANNFTIIDSTKGVSLPIKYIFKNSKPKTYFLCFNDSLLNNSEYYVIAENIFDNSNNLLTKQELFLTQSSAIDTLKPKVVNVITKFDNKTIDFEEPNFVINFNDGINLQNILDNCKVFSSKNDEMTIDKSIIDDATLFIKIKESIKPKSKFKFVINTDKIFDAAGNKIDSLYQLDLSVVDDLVFSGVSGKVNKVNNIKKNIKIESKANKYEKELNEKGEFNFKNIVPGKYLLWIYEDSDSNNVYSNGKVFPYKNSEVFYVYPDTLNLRARWPIGDIEIDY